MKKRKRQEYAIYDVTDNEIVVFTGNIYEVMDYLGGISIHDAYNRINLGKLFRYKYRVEKLPKDDD